MYLFYPLLFLIQITLSLFSQCSISWDTVWCPLFTTILLYAYYASRDLILWCWWLVIFILISAVKLPVLLMEFQFSPLAYFLLRKSPESQRKLQKLCIGGLVSTLGRIEARRIVVLEYMSYALTAFFLLEYFALVLLRHFSTFLVLGYNFFPVFFSVKNCHHILPMGHC